MDGELQPLPCQVSAPRLHTAWEPGKSCVWPGKAQGRCDQADGFSSSCHHPKGVSEQQFKCNRRALQGNDATDRGLGS